MKKPEKINSLLERMQELGKKYGVKVTDGSERGIRAIGFLGGVGKKDELHGNNDSHAASGGPEATEGAF